ncbi:MAG: ATP-binding protein [Lachnospiraceae bacterium]|nr:ATP-binding protein [Lachnospiraceae bacterium]
MVIRMTDYLYMGIQYFAALLEMGFLYIWLRTFSERRKLNHVIISVVILCSAAVRCYTNYMGNTALSMTLELACCFLISILLFSERYRSLFFYTITNYALGASVEWLFSQFLNLAEMRWLVLIILLKMALQFAVYYYILRRITSTKPQYTWKQYLMFCSIPIAVCSFIAWICTLGNSYDLNIEMKIVLAIAGAAFIIADSAAVYLHETLNTMMMKVKALEMINKRSELEAKHYQNMDNLHEQYDSFIHDMKHTMRTIAALAEEGDCEKIGNLIDKTRMNIGNIEQKMICSNKILNALLLERKSYADDNSIVMEADIREPLYFQEIDELDLIALMGNLLDNAIEAEKYVNKREGILLSIRMAREGRHIIIHLENSYEEKHNIGKVSIKQSMQIGNKHGIGLKNVRDIVRKYGGIIENEKSEGRYLVKVILPVQSEWEGQKSYSSPAPSYLQLLSK